jgi:hypothetical protein
MKLESNKDHHQGQSEAWKSAIHILQVLYLKWHKNFKKNWKNLRLLLHVGMVSLHLP